MWSSQPNCKDLILFYWLSFRAATNIWLINPDQINCYTTDNHFSLLFKQKKLKFWTVCWREAFLALRKNILSTFYRTNNRLALEVISRLIDSNDSYHSTTFWRQICTFYSTKVHLTSDTFRLLLNYYWLELADFQFYQYKYYFSTISYTTLPAVINHDYIS